MTARITSLNRFNPFYLPTVGNLLETPTLRKLYHWLNLLLRKAFKASTTIQHRYGYEYQPILCHGWIEVLRLRWTAGNCSEPHSHKASFNLTRVASGGLLERKYHISGGRLIVTSERILKPGQWAWTLPFQVHELVVLDQPAQTLHFYFPAR